jgi:Raf kinase inhibitor-like YbhB/YbcL family protein
LKWTGVPQGAESIALISDDPDAPGGAWVHWVLYALPPDAAELSGGVPPEEVLPNGGRQGITDFKQIGYGGPCPSPSSPYRYLFKVYAMDTQVGLAPGATKKELLAAMDGHILAQGQLTGTYQRR